MSGGVLIGGPGIEDDDVAATKTAHQVFEGHRLCVGPVAEFLTNEVFEITQPAFGNQADGPRELEHRWIGEGVMNEQPLAPRLDQAGLLQGLQMLRGVRGREADFGCQRLDRAFALGKQFENLEAEGLDSPFPMRAYSP